MPTLSQLDGDAVNASRASGVNTSTATSAVTGARSGGPLLPNRSLNSSMVSVATTGSLLRPDVGQPKRERGRVTVQQAADAHRHSRSPKHYSSKGRLAMNTSSASAEVKPNKNYDVKSRLYAAPLKRGSAVSFCL